MSVCTEDSPGSVGGCGCGSVEDGEVLTSGTAPVEGERGTRRKGFTYAVWIQGIPHYSN